MKRFGGRILLVLAGLLIISLSGCSRPAQTNTSSNSIPPNNKTRPAASGITLGPMPEELEISDPTIHQMLINMRSWVDNLKPEDAKTLKDTGKLVFTWEQLKASYPEQAIQADNYTETRRVGTVEFLNKKNKPISARLAVHHFPDTVEIHQKGGYWIVIRSNEGTKYSTLKISQ